MPAVAVTAKDALVEAVQRLQLPGIGDNVVPQWQLDLSNVSYAVCLCLPGEMPEEVSRGTTEHLDTLHSFLLLFLGRDGRREHEAEAEYQGWREEVMTYLRKEYRHFLAGVPGGRRVLVEPRTVVDPRRAEREYMTAATALLVRVETRTAR